MEPLGSSSANRGFGIQSGVLVFGVLTAHTQPWAGFLVPGGSGCGLGSFLGLGQRPPSAPPRWQRVSSRHQAERAREQPARWTAGSPLHSPTPVGHADAPLLFVSSAAQSPFPAGLQKGCHTVKSYGNTAFYYKIRLISSLLITNSKHAMQGQDKSNPCPTFKEIVLPRFLPGKLLSGAKKI